MSLTEFVNDRAVLMRNTNPRNTNPRASRFLVLKASPPFFRVAANGAMSPSSITLTASIFGVPGVASWTTDGVVLSGSADNVRTLAASAMTAETATISVQLSYQGEIYNDTQIIQKLADGAVGVSYTWIKYADSAAGAGLSDNPDGKAYIGFAYNKTVPEEGTDPLAYTWSLIKGTDGVPGAPGADGVSTFTWIKYSDNADGTGLYDLPTASTLYIGIAVNKATATESTNKTDYVWSKFKGDQGVPGAPGAPGADGAATYTWVKYATSSAGVGLSDSPDGMSYIGFAYNKLTPVESTTPGDYQWALLRGGDGVPGAPGADGVTPYTWIKYADAPDGTGLYDTPNSDTLYIGIAVNRPVAAESSVKTDYVWSRFKGDQGVPGAPGTPGAAGAAGARGNVNISATIAGSAWSDAAAVAALAGAGYGAPQVKDIVALANPSIGFVATKIYTGAAWTALAAFFDGALLINGTVYTDALSAGAITTDKLAATSITVDKLAAGAVTATKLSIVRLSDVNPDVGTLRTRVDNGGGGVEIRSNKIQIYTETNAEVVRMGYLL